jgi:hypothetical protein
VNGTKERERNGKAVYHIAGEFMKQGGGKKSLNWKVNYLLQLFTCRHVGLLLVIAKLPITKKKGYIGAVC